MNKHVGIPQGQSHFYLANMLSPPFTPTANAFRYPQTRIRTVEYGHP
ncbi:hypothetical protein [Agarivorans sp. Z349TD_7]